MSNFLILRGNLAFYFYQNNQKYLLLNTPQHNEGTKFETTNRQIISLAAPISLAMLIPQVNFFTNTVFLGRLGEQELGVNGITGVFYMILTMVGYGLSSGVQVLMARRAGEENRSGLAETFMNGVMLSVVFSLSMMLLSMWLVPLVFGLSLSSSSNFILSVNFMYIRVWGLPFIILTQLINSFFITIGRSSLLIYGSVMVTLTNIFFDYSLIFGHFGLPAMGFNGAAVASVIAEVVFCVTMATLFFANNYHKQYPVMRFIHLDGSLSLRTLSVAAPLIVQFLFSIGGWLVFFIFIEHLGSKALAASQMLRNLFGIIGLGTWALATTCNTMVSNIIGQGKQYLVEKVIKKIAKLSLVYAIVVGLLLLVFARQFLSVYSADADLVAYAVPSLRVIVTASIIMSLSTVVFNGVVGTGNTLVNLTIEVTCVCLYLIYCYKVIYVDHSQLYLCWCSEFVYWTCLLVTATLYLRSGKWKGKRI